MNRTDTYELNIRGVVQGVGFRPFIWRTARHLELKGTVTNTTEGVLIKVNVKDKEELLNLIDLIKKNKPAPSVIEDISYRKTGSLLFEDFSISDSLQTEEKFQLISPDIATCSDCIDDINKKSDTRRFYYPFTNCTNCGPRFTIIRDMPYDRPNTTMGRFRMCPDCKKEYYDPSDRRFHAQPNACNTCGPVLKLVGHNGVLIEYKKPIQKTAELIKKGKIVGIKSLGGFQIACDATDDYTVSRLRARKKRPAKPFALMFKDIEMVKKYLFVSEEEEKSLMSTPAPIVLLKKKHMIKKNTGYLENTESSGSGIDENQKISPKIKMISYSVSFYNKYEGAFLPYTPLHHLLFNDIDFPLVMTSGNISEEPIASKNDEADDKLSGICDYFLIHNRDIYSKYDDSVIKIFNKKEMVMRRARGYAPYPVKLDINIEDKAILAVGAMEKNTFCIVKKNYAIISQHIGDLETIDSYDFFKSTLQNYRKLFGIKRFDMIVYDKHPDYISSRFALDHFKDVNKTAIQHHKAHIAGVVAENRLFSRKYDEEIILGFSWDGTGYGDDRKIWGSEIFLVTEKLDFFRVGHLEEKLMPGGEITIKKPYRMAIAYLYRLWQEGYRNKAGTFHDFICDSFPFYKEIIKKPEFKILISQVEGKYNSPVTTSMGRFFDAVSSILDLVHVISYESEAAVKLEMIADESISDSYDVRFKETGVIKEDSDKKNIGDLRGIVIDDFYIFKQILKDLDNKIPQSHISAKFHNTLAEIILQACLWSRKSVPFASVALSGGVFQNNLLIKKSFDLLSKRGFKPYTKFKVPVNDGGISFGQAYLGAKKLQMI